MEDDKFEKFERVTDLPMIQGTWRTDTEQGENEGGDEPSPWTRTYTLEVRADGTIEFRILILAATLLVGCAVVAGAQQIEYDYTSGWPKACADAGSGLVFDVSFYEGNHHENGVYILEVDEANIDMAAVNANTPSVAATFNSHHGRGAGGYWKAGNGQYVTGEKQERTCYLIISRHKRTGPAGGEPLIGSHF